MNTYLKRLKCKKLHLVLCTQECLQLSCSLISSCVIFSSRAWREPRRKTWHSTNWGAEDTHCYRHRLLALSCRCPAKYRTDCIHNQLICISADAHNSTLYKCSLKQTIMSEWAFQESCNTERILLELELAWPCHLKGMESNVCACLLVLLLFVDWGRHGVSGFKVKEDSKQGSLPTQGQITWGSQTGWLAEWNEVFWSLKNGLKDEYYPADLLW